MPSSIYREPASRPENEQIVIVVPTPEKPKFGRLSTPRVQLHKCILPQPPGWLAKLFGARFQFDIGDLFRCECGEVYRFCPFDLYKKDDEFHLKDYECNHKGNCRYSLCEWWVHSSIKEWKLAGGEE